MILPKCAYCGTALNLGKREAPDLPVCGPQLLTGLVCHQCGNVERGGKHYLAGNRLPQAFSIKWGQVVGPFLALTNAGTAERTIAPAIGLGL